MEQTAKMEKEEEAQQPLAHVQRLAALNVDLEKERKADKENGTATRRKNVLLAASGSVASIKVLLLVQQLASFANVRLHHLIFHY
jgi:hypothetical protein